MNFLLNCEQSISGLQLPPVCQYPLVVTTDNHTLNLQYIHDIPRSELPSAILSLCSRFFKRDTDYPCTLFGPKETSEIAITL